MSPQVNVPSQIIVIRRIVGEQDAGHKGGVWKIAYADFMTAMMAFFLVMWLINASEELELTQIANYFNPLKLTGANSSPKGLNDLQSGAKGAQKTFGSAAETTGKQKSDRKGKSETATKEELLFKDPYGSLNRLAEQAILAAGGSRSNFSGGEVVRDPFDPAFRKVGGMVAAKAAETRSMAVFAATAAPSGGGIEGAVDGYERSVPSNPSINAPAVTRDISGEARGANEAVFRQEATRAEGNGPKLEKAISDEAAAIAADMAEISKGAAMRGGPHIEIAAAPEGVLIRLTDNNDFGMFAIASAEPRPELVVLMEKIGNILARRAGPIVVRGHTDGRQYKAATYDNWRLSTARAHMAYHMLVRGGIVENRFERIEGHADRDLRVANDPSAAQNRRVEILLKKEKL